MGVMSWLTTPGSPGPDHGTRDGGVDWRARGRADAPVVVRSLLLAISGDETAPPSPRRMLAATMISDVLTGDGGVAGALLGQLAAEVYRAEWMGPWAAEGGGGPPTIARQYLSNLLPPVDHARAQGRRPRRGGRTLAPSHRSVRCARRRGGAGQGPGISLSRAGRGRRDQGWNRRWRDCGRTPE
jgi:hypothetical protein